MIPRRSELLFSEKHKSCCHKKRLKKMFTSVPVELFHCLLKKIEQWPHYVLSFCRDHKKKQKTTHTYNNKVTINGL